MTKFILFLFFISLSKSHFEEIKNKYNRQNIKGGKTLNFYINIEKLRLNEEGIIIFKSDHEDPIKSFKLKYTFSNKKPNSESDFKDLKSDNSIKFNKTEINLFYHLYFKKKEQSNYFYLQIEIPGKGEYIEYAYSNLNIIEIKSGSEYQGSIIVEDFIPYFLKVYVTCLPYLYPNYLLVSNSNDMIVIKNLFEDNNNILKNKYLIQCDKNILSGEKSYFYIEFFGYSKEIFYFIKNMDNSIKVKNKEKRTNIELINFENVNPYSQLYFYGNYIYKSNDIIYIEPVIGNVRSYYSNRIENYNFDSFFPKENKDEKVNGNYIKVYSNFDLFTFYCDSYCYFNLYILHSNENHEVKDLTYYFLVSRNNPQKAIIKFRDEDLIKDEVLKFKSVNKKKVTISINQDNIISTIQLNEDKDIDFYYPSKKKVNITIELTTNSEETLIIVNRYYDGLCTIYKNEIIIPQRINKICGIFYLPDTLYYDKFAITFSGLTFHASFNVGIAKSKEIISPLNLLLDEEDLYNGNSIEILNPQKYLFESDLSPLESYYIIVYFNQNYKQTIDKITYEFITYDNLYPFLFQDTPQLLTKETEFKLLQNSESNKKLIIIVSKFGNKIIKMNLKVNDYLINEEYLEKPFNFYFYEDLGISLFLDFKKINNNDNFEGAYIYYNYVTDSELDNFQTNENFAISYSYDEQTNITSIHFNNPFSRKITDIKPIEISYKIFCERILNDNYTFNISKINYMNANVSLISNNSFINVQLKLDRNLDYNIYVTGRVTEKSSQLRPIFFYPNIILRKFIDDDKVIQKNTSNVYKVFIFIAILLIGVLIFVYILYSKMKKTQNRGNYNQSRYQNLISQI